MAGLQGIAASGAAAPAYSIDEQRQLTRNLETLIASVQTGTYNDESFAPSLLCKLHRQLFGGVRGHAGTNRSSRFGSEYLIFGPHRSVHRDNVELELNDAFETVRKSIRSLDENREDPSYERSAIHIALWLHAEVIRIHPFEDGNGRTARLLASVILVRVGLLSLPASFPREEYYSVLTEYYADRKMDPLIDLFLRVYEYELALLGVDEDDM